MDQLFEAIYSSEKLYKDRCEQLKIEKEELKKGIKQVVMNTLLKNKEKWCEIITFNGLTDISLPLDFTDFPFAELAFNNYEKLRSEKDIDTIIDPVVFTNLSKDLEITCYVNYKQKTMDSHIEKGSLIYNP